MDRIANIKAYAERAQIEAEEKASAEIKLRNDLEEQIKDLRSRISSLLAVANACLDNNIPIRRKDMFSTRRGYENNDFLADGINHQIGFYPRWESVIEYHYIGITNGGACGNTDFATDGLSVNGVLEESNVMVAPRIKDMQRFLKEFNEFETKFYGYVDKVTGGNNGQN